MTTCTAPHCSSYPNSVSECEGCETGYDLSQGLCIQTGCKVLYCVTCDPTNIDKCSECEPNYVKDEANGLCKSDFCTDANCRICTDDKITCTLCDEHYDKESGKCLQTCSDDLHCGSTQVCSEKNTECVDCKTNEHNYDGQCKCGIDNTTCTEYETCYEDTGSNFMCKSCLDLMDNCDKCNNSTTCTECYDGTAPTDNKCAASRCTVSHCHKCATAADTCDLCVDGYEASSNLCVQTGCKAENCVMCATDSTTNCAECAPNYRLNTDTKKCEPIICVDLNCSVCSDEHTCVQCNANYEKINNACLQVCAEVTCALTSQICSADNKCTDCRNNEVNCRNQCVCSAEKMICHDTEFCESSESYSGCTSCQNAISNCLNCDTADKCDLCTNGNAPTDNKCPAVACTVSHCANCTGDVTKCIKCDEGYDPDVNLCRQTGCDAIDCITCDKDMKTCTECFPGYVFDTTTSQCAAPKCKDINCSQCTGDLFEVCDGCADGYAQNGDSICVQKCGAADCPTTSVCSSGVCEACKNNEINFSGRCVCGNNYIPCLDSQYCDANTCMSCQTKMKNCAKCDAATVCDELANACTVKSCAMCQDDAAVCTKCSDGSAPKDNSCENTTPCADQNCSYCPDGPNTCTNCQTGFQYDKMTLLCLQICSTDGQVCGKNDICDNNICKVCGVNQLNIGGICKCGSASCKSGQFCDETSSCASCVSHCSSCSNATTCQDCDKHYKMKSGKCEKQRNTTAIIIVSIVCVILVGLIIFWIVRMWMKRWRPNGSYQNILSDGEQDKPQEQQVFI